MMKDIENLYNSMSDRSNISILTTRCLKEIFSYLSIRERIKIQRVCKTWKKASKSSFHEIHHLEIDSRLLGDNYAKKNYRDIHVILKQIFSLCRSNLKSISLKSTSLTITGDMRFYEVVKRSCPNLQSIYLSYCNKEIIQYLNFYFTDLSSVSFERCTQDCEWWLSDYLSHNENLKSITIENNDELTGNCLQDLGKFVESISIKFCRKISPEHIGNVVTRLVDLKSLTLAGDFKFVKKINAILQCIPVNSSIEKLDVCCFSVDRDRTISDEWNVENLTNLRDLTLKGSVLFYDKTMSRIAKYCKKLAHVSFIDCEYVITDSVMKSFIESLELESLFISKSTIQSVRCMTSVTTLVCYSCHLLDASSFESLIKASRNLQRLDIMMCNKVNVKCLIDAACKTHTRNEILEVNYMDRQDIVNVRIAASRLYIMKDSSKLLSK